MDEGVLVDTCIWIDYFRGAHTVSKKLETLIRKDVVYSAGIILYEIFQGTRSRKEQAVLEEVFQAIPYVDMNTRTWLNAAQLSRKLKTSGITLPPSDILLAQVAIENGLSILTVDEHFSKIPGVVLEKGSG